MTLEAWGDRLSPDIPQTIRRFPLPLVLAAAATLIFIAVMNGAFPGQDELITRTVGGLATAAIFATAGIFYSESRPTDRTAGLVLRYLVPIVVIALFQVRDTTWFVPYALPVIAVLWLSISPVARGWRSRWRPGQQDRFWWINHRAVASGAIAALALLLISIGILALERTVRVLFGLDTSSIFYETILPAIGGFFAPLYWLSTLPRLEEYDERVLVHPDFLARAVGLVGKFVLIPLLLAYGSILYLYFGQSALTWRLPAGTLGWMVLGFVTAGAAAILVLHPQFMRESRIVAVFRRSWFWLTIVPLILFGLAVFIRVDAYGLTPQRLMLIWGGLWAVLLTAAFLLRRGDIRMIPALAAIVLLVATIGPWNLENLPRVHQAMRLDALLTGRNADPSVSVPSQPVLTAEESAAVRGAIAYLAKDEPGRHELSRVMRLHGHDIWPDQATAGTVAAAIGDGLLPDGPAPTVATYTRANRGLGDQPVDVGRTPLLVGDLAFWGSNAITVGSMSMRIYDTFVSMHPLATSAPAGESLRADLTSWIAQQRDGQPIVEPWIDFTAGDTAYRFVVEEVTIVHRWDEPAPVINSIRGSLFASRRFLLPP